MGSVKFRLQKCLALTKRKVMMCSIPLLKYRETEGIKVQQNAIDTAKGIVAKPMPRYWHDRHSVNQIEDIEEKRFQLSIVADKKPYFMRLVYPTLARQYNTYIKTTNKNAVREFGITIDELERVPESDRTARQNDFLRYYYNRMPVGIGDCVMNKICRRFEQEFDGYLRKRAVSKNFSYDFLKSDAEYTSSEFRNISKLYSSYCKRIGEYAMYANYERIDDAEYDAMFAELRNEFVQSCDTICPNRDSLMNILLDLCYTKSSTKKFVWDVCGADIIRNLLLKSDGIISYPTATPDGDIHFVGKRFCIKEARMEGHNGNCFE